MATEPENVMLRLLREVRAKMDEHDGRFDDQDKQLSELRKQIEDWQETTSTHVGFAAHANIRTQSLEREIAELKRRIDRLEKAH